MEPIKTEVVIVGAGPTGLSLAAQCLRLGVSFVILDKKEGVTNLSKALVVHARSLEIYEQIGLAQTAVENGAVVQNAVIIHDGETRATLDFATIGGELSPFPFMLMFEQSKNEHLLENYLQTHGQNVRWQTELSELTQDDSGVQAVLKDASGQTQTIDAHYLVGCDGASSATRHLLGLGFEGSTYPRIFYVADVDTDFDGQHDSIYASFEANAFLLLFPMTGEKHWRLIGPLPEYEETLRANPNQDVKISYEDVQDKIRTTMKRPLNIEKVHWFSTYKVHTRHAEIFSKGRCFLAGDAAHVHTPAGGQGMNTGIQDAYNLAWKIALTLKNHAGDSLLDTYNSERLANAKRLLHTTDQFFDIAAGDTWYQRFFRDSILPGLARFAWRFDAVKDVIFPTLSQIGIHYPDSALSAHDGDAHFKVKAGDRMPYFSVNGVSVYDLLRAPKFHLLTFFNENAPSEKQSSFDALLDRYTFALSPEVAEIFGSEPPFSVLLRPDNYIGRIAPTLSENDLSVYFAKFGLSRP